MPATATAAGAPAAGCRHHFWQQLRLEVTGGAATRLELVRAGGPRRRTICVSVDVTSDIVGSKSGATRAYASLAAACCRARSAAARPATSGKSYFSVVFR